jgi:hypothetical protein
LPKKSGHLPLYHSKQHQYRINVAANFELELRNIVFRVEDPLYFAKAVPEMVATSTQLQTRLIFVHFGQECRQCVTTVCGSLPESEFEFAGGLRLVDLRQSDLKTFERLYQALKSGIGTMSLVEAVDESVNEFDAGNEVANGHAKRERHFLRKRSVNEREETWWSQGWRDKVR